MLKLSHHSSKMQIGISVLSVEGLSHWSNGIRQNALFLGQLMRALPFVSRVFMLETGSVQLAQGREHFEKLGLVYARPEEVIDDIDLAIEMVGAYPISFKRLLRARGKKVVYLCCGQPYAALAEDCIFERPGDPIEMSDIDQIWLLPKDRGLIPLMRTIYRCPVFVAPYLWSPYFIEDRISEVAQHDFEYGYQGRTMQPEDSGFRVAIFEPNISVVKTSVVPMLACDMAYRQQPEALQFMNVLCADHLVNHPTMLYLGNSLDLVRHHRAVFLGRHDVVGFMSQHANAVVAHQWENEQNYSYLDVLYGQYPLIHNSEWLWREFGAGYYYPDFDAGLAGEQIVQAWQRHDQQLDDYKAKAQRAIHSLSPLNPNNIGQMAEIIQGLYA
jgi:hypothetical protein